MAELERDGVIRFESYNPFFTERTERLHAMLLNCGHELVRSAEYSWDGRRRGNHTLLIWQYTLNGLGCVEFEGERYPVPAGSAFFLMVPEAHVYFLPPESESWEFLYVTVTGSELARLGAEYRRRNGIVRPFAPGSPVVREAWELLAICREKRLGGRYDASARAYSFLMRLMAEPPANALAARSDFMMKIHAFCRKNLDRPITVEMLAEVAGCSRGHFTRRFQELEGISPHEFIVRQKMRLAVRLLQTTVASVKEISAACGFEDTSYFCKVFRQYHGTSPGGYRTGGAGRPPVF
ncbi:AraC family transcriptional regulator [uncultured Victivallis sp.]|uniref:AraC family transcriptional regulator n=1 Tax=uncultured Victivallis sp. TaxID=354118 RepID=UPI0025DD791A|nr:AraC family transcriptional regulator [uncultured Victivallis sp.]